MNNLKNNSSSIKDTMTRFDKKFLYEGEQCSYPIIPIGTFLNNAIPSSIKQFIAEEIKLALEGITPKVKTEAFQDAKDEFMLIGWNACIEKSEELKNNYLKQ